MNIFKKKANLSFDEFDEFINFKPKECAFDRIIETALSRRDMLKSILAFGSVSALAGKISPASAQIITDPVFKFEAIQASTEDIISLPKGYQYKPLIFWGDPLWSKAAEFDPITRGSAKSQMQAFGDNPDGQEIFQFQGHTLLVVNNEYANRRIIWGNLSNTHSLSDDDITKSMMAHGVSIFEIMQTEDGWALVKDSRFNRRITPHTEMILTGSAAGHTLLQTQADPTGTQAKGTWNNCGSGRTPWGTYLTCEENFNGYFSTDASNYEVPKAFQRYGVSNRDWGYRWASLEERFDVAKHPNTPNHMGYVVEIDPIDPQSKPRKLTALGRFKHENAELVVNKDRRIVVYMGDDERGEFIYRFVSDGLYEQASNSHTLLEKGTLYAAKFYDDGTGRWLALTPETTGMETQAQICIHTRQAGSAVEATTMDRPEWIAINPYQTEVYCALTNNKSRGLKSNTGGDFMAVGGPNPREANRYGQIIRWWPKDEDHTAEAFTWDLFVLAGNPVQYEDARAGSDNIHAGNMFNSPDGLQFDRNGLLWIQTDGKDSNAGDFAGHGNNQMLVADPKTGEIRRFLVGPKGCEITGLSWSPDYRTMFVGIQHPGDGQESHWPEGGNTVPRSAIIAVSREDGAVIG